jgi:hypothetical protein
MSHYATIEGSMDHRKIEERSLALHRAIARRVRQDPKHLEAVRKRLADDVRSGKYSSSVVAAMEEWLEILNRSSRAEVLKLLVDKSEEAKRLRQSSPFVGILNQEERLRIFRRYESSGV